MFTVLSETQKYQRDKKTSWIVEQRSAKITKPSVSRIQSKPYRGSVNVLGLPDSCHDIDVDVTASKDNIRHPKESKTHLKRTMDMFSCTDWT